jgi:aspartyl aminopeptidase
LNSGFKYNPQHHLAAIISASLRDELAAICRSSDAVEMWLCDGQAPACDDTPDGLIQAPRLDNLASCHAALKALCSADTAGLKHIPAVALFDLEECGDNFHSARGTLLDTMFESIRENLNLSRSEFSAVAARSWIISCDAAHGFHPNFPELYDAAYAPVPGSGIALKTNANQRYATTVAGEAFFNSICSAAGVRSQRFAVRSDMRCGSTLGPGCAMRTGIPTVDIGIPLLAMHSIRETASLNDLDALTAFCAAALNG